MLVSVVVPNMNKAPFLEETLRSLFAQEHAEVEIIAVDGGSTDGSREIFERHLRAFARYVAEPDLGQADAVNKGLALARGELVAWLNSDDLYFPWTVRRAVERFMADPDLSLLYGDCVFIDRESRFLRYFMEIEPYDERRLRNCGNYIMQPAAFFRRSAWEAAGGLDPTMHYAFDYEFWCRLARAGLKIERLPEPLAANRVYDETKTISGGSARMREIWEVYSRHRTGWWRHGYWNFRGGDLMHRCSRASGGIGRFWYFALALGSRALGCGNWGYAFRHPGRVQGFVGNGGDCLSRARLCLPVRSGDLALRIEASPARGWRGGCFVPASEVRFALDAASAAPVVLRFTEGRRTGVAEIPLSDAVRRRAVASVDVVFDADAGDDVVAGRIRVLAPKTNDD